MKKQYMINSLMCCLLLWGGSTVAFSQDDDFNPANPEEPATVSICRLSVSADPEEGAYVSGGGKYIVNGNSVYISSSARNTADYTYTFLYWTLNGEKKSYSQDFWYTPQKGNYELVAHYQKAEVVFDPESPQEPSATNIKRKYYLYLNSNIEGACSFNMNSGVKHEEQSGFYVEAYLNSGYQFEGWKLNGNTVSTSQSFYFDMPSANTTLEACVSEIPFDPENPMEPTGSGSNVDNTGRQLVNLIITKDGVEVDKTRVVFNEQKTLEYDISCDASKFISNEAVYQIYSIGNDGTTRYSINERPLDDGNVRLGIIAQQSGEATISATRLDRSAFIYDKVLNTYQDLSVKGYTFTCNAGTFDDRFILTTTGPNFVLGDANGDGDVTITDAVGVVNYILGNPSDNFSFKAADVNGDENISITDAVGVVNIILGTSGSAPTR